MKIIHIILIFFTCSIALAETYYIDYISGNDNSSGTSKNSPWKLCPGMKGFAGAYSYSPGDKFVLKGGVTWPKSVTPFSIKYSGSTESPIVYIGGQFEAESWGTDYPIIDGGGSIPDWSSIIECHDKNYVTIVGLMVVNADEPGGKSKAGGIRINGSSNIDISYCRIRPFGTVGIKADNIGNNVKIHHNDISDVANFYETNKTTGICDNLKIHDNSFHDPGSMMAGGDHVDGIHLFSYLNGFSDGLFTNLKIYNNHWYGDWSAKDNSTGVTACIFIEQRPPNILAKDVLIYNNLVNLDVENSAWTGSPTTIASIFSIGAAGINILNNTIIIKDSNETAHIFGCGSTSSNVIFENNMIVGHDNLIAYFNTKNASSVVTSWDHNVINTTSETIVKNVNDYLSLNSWKQLGFDLESSLTAPELDSDFRPIGTNTMAVSSGKIQTMFNVDKQNIRRSETGWSIGALENLQRKPNTPWPLKKLGE